MQLNGIVRAVIGSTLFAPVLVAQDFSYPDFTSLNGLVLNANAAQAGAVLRVTPNLNGQVGSFYYDQPTRVANGFDTTFEIQISQLGGGGADGMTFIIHNSSGGLASIGSNGSGMGYAENGQGAMDNALAIEFDTWNSGQGDPDANHVSVHTAGTGQNQFTEDQSLGNATPASNLSDGAVHAVRIRYEGGVLDVFVDDLANPLLSVKWDFTNGGTYINGNSVGGLNLIGGDSAYLGFTAGTGGANENHDVLSWYWNDAAGPIGTPYCGPANKNSTGLPAVISAYGSEAVTSNNVRLDAVQLPPNQMGYYLNSQTQGFVVPPGSQGFLCLGGAIGRHNSPVLNTGAGGEMHLQLDLTRTPTPFGPTAIQPGETWYFQCWFHDQNPGATSNFSDGICIKFQ